MSPSDVAYYQKRLREERERAEAAAEPHVARIHAELANRYEALIRLRPIA